MLASTQSRFSLNLTFENPFPIHLGVDTGHHRPLSHASGEDHSPAKGYLFRRLTDSFLLQPNTPELLYTVLGV